MKNIYRNYFKRIIDIVASFFLVLLFWPLMLIAAILIKIEEPNAPILFRQQRPGKDEKIFTIYKFRTMKAQLYDLDGNPLSDMERMTKVGNILRKTSIDEFPQFINVLMGDMSFIGPRPLLTQYLNHYNEIQRRRHSVRPGISGWAQVNGRNAITWDERFDLDVWYVDNLSWKVDLCIVIKTITNVLASKNVNNSEVDTMPDFGE